ncbi:hypothetical protein AB9M75_10780 [Lactobacillus sp. AN1001]
MKKIIKYLKAILIFLVKITMMYSTVNNILLLYLVLNYRTVPTTIYFFRNTLFIFLITYLLYGTFVFADKYGNYVTVFLIELERKIGKRLSKDKK